MAGGIQSAHMSHLYTWYTTPATQEPYGYASDKDVGVSNRRPYADYIDLDDRQAIWLGDSGQVTGYCLPQLGIGNRFHPHLIPPDDSLGVTRAHLTIVAAYCNRNCCCDTPELVFSQSAAAARPVPGAAAEDAAAGRAQKLASHKAVSSRDAVMSTPKGTRPRALHASTCRQQTNQLLTNLLLLPLLGHAPRTPSCAACHADVIYVIQVGQLAPYPTYSTSNVVSRLRQQPVPDLVPLLPAHPRYYTPHFDRECSRTASASPYRPHQPGHEHEMPLTKGTRTLRSRSRQNMC